ncbi:MAG: hypothetical protein LVR00_07615 [Rhabdochlamydiaceae bacterium]|jgi:hypothetical protein
MTRITEPNFYPVTPLRVLTALLQTNTRLVQAILKRVEACRKEHIEGSERASKRQEEKLAAERVQTKRLDCTKMPKLPFVR